jgi:hypothetical protein
MGWSQPGYVLRNGFVRSLACRDQVHAACLLAFCGMLQCFQVGYSSDYYGRMNE